MSDHSTAQQAEHAESRRKAEHGDGSQSPDALAGVEAFALAGGARDLPRLAARLTGAGDATRARVVTSLQRARGNFAIQRFVSSARLARVAATNIPSATAEGAAAPAEDTALERDANGVAVDAEEAIAAAEASSGEPLPAELQRQFQESLGADVRDVRVHTDAASAAAATSVGAMAYTVGNDIHFASGQFDPTSASGQRLLAHEVAHTVQQGGTASTVRQAKLEVSDPGDAHEVEAERFAQSFVDGRASGGSTIPLSAVAGSEVHRAPPAGAVANKTDPKAASGEKQWAQDTRDKVQTLQKAADGASERLNNDAKAALGALRAAAKSFDDFHKRYDKATDRFLKGVKEAQEKAAEIREAFKAAFELALMVTGASLVGEAEEVFEALEKTYEVLDKLNAMAPALGLKQSNAAVVKAGKADKADYSKLVDTALDAFEKYIQQNEVLSAITAQCHGSVDYLSKAIETDPFPKDAKTTPEGQAADKLGTGAADATAKLAAMPGGSLSTAPVAFAKDAATNLDQTSDLKIEQDIAIKWVAGLSKDQLDAANDAESYLREIHLIGPEGSRLGTNFHPVWTTALDLQLVSMRAQMENAAMGLVGQTVEWMGYQPGMFGSIRADGEIWPATVGGGLSKDAGGYVLVQSYTIRPIEDEEKSEWSHPNTTELRERMHDKVRFHVVAQGPTGGGALPDGPSIGPAKDSGE